MVKQRKKTIEGISFVAEEQNRERLGACYNRYDTKITADKPFTESQVLKFICDEKISYGQKYHLRPVNDFPTLEAIYEDYVDSSD